MFLGYVTLEDTLHAPVLIVDAAGVPINLDAGPVVRVYGPLGLIPGVTVLGTALDHGVVTAVTNTTPIVITSVNHGLTGSTFVTVSGVAGTTTANGSWMITRVDVDRFSLNGSSGNGAYVSGGTWNVAGLFTYAINCTSASGFEVATTYYTLITGSVAGVATAVQQTFIVV